MSGEDTKPFTGHPQVTINFTHWGTTLSAELVNDDLSQLVKNAVNVVDGDELAHYVQWNFKQLLHHLRPHEINPNEYMALNVILAKAMSRKLSLTGSGHMVTDPRITDILARLGIDAEVRRPVLRVVDSESG